MNADASFARALEGLDAGSASRSGALLLHAVDDDDRQWLLAQLAPPQRAAMDALLQDLALLGIAPDRALIDDVLNSPRRTAAPLAPEEVLARASAGRLARLLADEPDGLVAALLRRDWPWKDGLLRRLEPIRRRRLREAGAAAQRRGRALEQALIDAVAQRLAAGGAPALAARRARFVGAVRRGFGALLARCTRWRRT